MPIYADDTFVRVLRDRCKKLGIPAEDVALAIPVADIRVHYVVNTQLIESLLTIAEGLLTQTTKG